jgi:hypothetical protein
MPGLIFNVVFDQLGQLVVFQFEGIIQINDFIEGHFNLNKSFVQIFQFRSFGIEALTIRVPFLVDLDAGVISQVDSLTIFLLTVKSVYGVSVDEKVDSHGMKIDENKDKKFIPFSYHIVLKSYQMEWKYKINNAL